MTRDVLLWAAGLFLAGLGIVVLFCRYQMRQRRMRHSSAWWGEGL